MINKLKKILIIFLVFIISQNYIYAKEDEYFNKLDGYVNEIEKHLENNSVENLDLNLIKNDLIKGNGINKKHVFTSISLNIVKEIRNCIKGYSVVFIIILFVNLINALNDFNNQSIKKISSIVILLVVSQNILTGYIDILNTFKKTVEMFNVIMQISIPFITTLSALSLNVSSVKITMPSLLFMSQLSMIIANKIISPLSTLSIVIGTVTYINSQNMLKNFSKFLNKFAFTSLAAIFSIFLCILSLEGNISGSLDTLAGKTARVATNTIPVVGKFVAESLGAVVASCNLIKQVAGTITLIVMIIFLITPLIKILISILVLSFFESIVSQIEGDFKVSSLFAKFKDAYTLLASVLVLTFTLLTISTGIMIKMSVNI